MTPILFVDRDGTLIEEPDDYQVDSLAKVRFVRDVIPALLQICAAGYHLIMVTNQDGLGTAAFPRAAFEPPHRWMLDLFASQGIVFRDVLIDTSLPNAQAETRKPQIGLVMPYLRDPTIDWQRSAMVGDRPTDMLFAANLSIRGFHLATKAFGGEWHWPAIAQAVVNAPRQAELARQTNETRIRVHVNLDDHSSANLRTGLGFFDHMLDQLAKHAGFCLCLQVEGDLHVDDHHTVEDTALVLGQALRQALGAKVGIGRYGFTVPMDDALAQAVVDLSGRPYCVFKGTFLREKVGDFATELVAHFFQSLCSALGMTLHLRVKGSNDHHKIEACFKAVGRALRQAIVKNSHGLPSTKGTL